MWTSTEPIDTRGAARPEEAGGQRNMDTEFSKGPSNFKTTHPLPLSWLLRLLWKTMKRFQTLMGSYKLKAKTVPVCD